MSSDNLVLSPIHWTVAEFHQWRFYLAATQRGLCSSQVAIYEQEFLFQLQRRYPDCELVPAADPLEEYIQQLAQYFAGVRQRFEVPMDVTGTDFQRATWQALQEIPYGETRSYGEVARSIGRPQAARAVGGACNRNPLLVFIPCHRVVGRDGRLVGFGGGLELKRALLHLEERREGAGNFSRG
ncbi:MAG: methylated-DNA--[protein]-cysteine S-methyltransferase [Firmicutes bacterium]|nr:methylated-DNA--[protein]-cysteine S-methyltransferase [Bacillota bacterium]